MKSTESAHRYHFENPAGEGPGRKAGRAGTERHQPPASSMRGGRFLWLQPGRSLEEVHLSNSMNSREENTEDHEAAASAEADRRIEEYFPAPEEAHKRITEGDFADCPELLKIAFLLATRVEHAAELSHRLRDDLGKVAKQTRQRSIDSEEVLREAGINHRLAALARRADWVDLSDSDEKLYLYLGVEPRLEAVLIAFDMTTMRIENRIREICYTLQPLTGQPLTPLMVRFLDYRREYRQYLESAIIEGQRDRVRESGLRQQWMGHMLLIGQTVNELSERLDLALKRRPRSEEASDGRTFHIQNSNVVITGGDATINFDQHLSDLRETIEAQPEDSPTFAKVAKKAALDIIGSALKDVAKGQVEEAAKQIYELGKELGPVVAQTAAYAFFRSHLGQ